MDEIGIAPFQESSIWFWEAENVVWATFGINHQPISSDLVHAKYHFGCVDTVLVFLLTILADWRLIMCPLLLTLWVKRLPAIWNYVNLHCPLFSIESCHHPAFLHKISQDSQSPPFFLSQSMFSCLESPRTWPFLAKCDPKSPNPYTSRSIWGFPARHGGTPIAGWLKKGTIP